MNLGAIIVYKWFYLFLFSYLFLLKQAFSWLYVLIMSRTCFRVNLHSTIPWISRNALLKTGAISKVKLSGCGFESFCSYLGSWFLKFSNGIMCEICSKLTIKRHQKDVSDIVMVSLLLTLNRSHIFLVFLELTLDK